MCDIQGVIRKVLLIKFISPDESFGNYSPGFSLAHFSNQYSLKFDLGMRLLLSMPIIILTNVNKTGIMLVFGREFIGKFLFS